MILIDDGMFAYFIDTYSGFRVVDLITYTLSSHLRYIVLNGRTVLNSSSTFENEKGRVRGTIAGTKQRNVSTLPILPFGYTKSNDPGN